MTPNKITQLSSVVLITLLAGQVLAQNTGDALRPQQQRISHEAIHADHNAFVKAQGRIKTLNDQGIEVDSYHLSKAQCWLDTSFHEYTRNDRGGYPRAALAESLKIVGALEAGKDPGWETPLVNQAEKLRPDLWARYDALRQSAGFHCAAQATACGEVELVHAGNEIHDGGWRHAKPYIQIAEDLISQAEQMAAECGQAKPVATTEAFDIAADALFAFDRSDIAGMKPEGKSRLDELAARLRDIYTSVDHITLVGHADRLGNAAHNQELSERRAWTVKAYLQDQGVTGPIQASGMGESQASGMTAHCVGERATPALMQCLQPDRRVAVQIVGIKATP